MRKNYSKEEHICAAQSAIWQQNNKFVDQAAHKSGHRVGKNSERKQCIWNNFKFTGCLTFYANFKDCNASILSLECCWGGTFELLSGDLNGKSPISLSILDLKDSSVVHGLSMVCPMLYIVGPWVQMPPGACFGHIQSTVFRDVLKISCDFNIISKRSGVNFLTRTSNPHAVCTPPPPMYVQS